MTNHIRRLKTSAVILTCIPKLTAHFMTAWPLTPCWYWRVNEKGDTPTTLTRSIWKMLGPFATACRFTLPFTRCCYCRMPPLSLAVCASMSTTTTTTTTTRDRGDRYGPMEWAQLPIPLDQCRSTKIDQHRVYPQWARCGISNECFWILNSGGVIYMYCIYILFWVLTFSYLFTCYFIQPCGCKMNKIQSIIGTKIGSNTSIFIDRVAGEIIRLVASVCVSVRLSVGPIWTVWPWFLAWGSTLTLTNLRL